ncbi:DUF4865 family protein [Methylovirgula sp. 4M-Z18]|uniref:DUF4865 family protein n=1 Tax=Methylovirgula sp. 4M-Z18 TaxID=2293567 RepID=UPI000E2E7D16|nr:DUF4865 family protein [Methylovirgula sp. 4M-Z18]RFB81173.1 DUF4865 family protein [Methylovirgula sp. 4M-Z18]
MIAMQYSFTLPADYDMAIIDRRIRDKGPLLDGFPHLRFKAYLAARKHDDGLRSAENLYAPFYLWDAPEGLNNFLTGPGFATVSRDFGWPSVRTWMVWHAELAPSIGSARFASRTVETIAPYSDLGQYRSDAIADAQAAARDGALASVTAFNPTDWTLVHFGLWDRVPEVRREQTQLYAVGHVSLP